MRLLFLRKFSASDEKYLVNKLNPYYDIIIPVECSDSELTALAANADVAIGNRVKTSWLYNTERLKVIQILGAGVDNVDVNSLSSHGITVCNSHSNAIYVAEFAVSLLHAAMKKIHHHDRFLRSGTWWRPQNTPDDTFYLSDTIFNKNIGVIGFGNIGSKIASLLSVYDTKFLVYDDYFNGSVSDGLKNRLQFTSLVELIRESDVIVIAVPLTPETENLISVNELNHMKKSSYLINISRGPVVNKKALYEALTNQIIRGAATDVWYGDEYNDENHRYPSREYDFHKLQNLVLSSYRAGYLMNDSPHLHDAVENLIQYTVSGDLRNVVDSDKRF